MKSGENYLTAPKKIPMMCYIEESFEHVFSEMCVAANFALAAKSLQGRKVMVIL